MDTCWLCCIALLHFLISLSIPLYVGFLRLYISVIYFFFFTNCVIVQIWHVIIIGFTIISGILYSKCYKYAFQISVVYEVILYMFEWKINKNLLLNTFNQQTWSFGSSSNLYKFNLRYCILELLIFLFILSVYSVIMYKQNPSNQFMTWYIFHQLANTSHQSSVVQEKRPYKCILLFCVWKSFNVMALKSINNQEESHCIKKILNENVCTS